MEVFNRLRPQIEGYKRQFGGDLEGAFQKVTGTPWPQGRSVKISGGMPQMTKDRTFKSVLGKYIAAPAAIGLTAAFAPGALPAVGKALAGVAMKGGTGALIGRTALGAAPGLMKGNWKGALAGGAMGAFSPGLGGVSGGAKSVGGGVMRDMLTKSGMGALEGGVQGGFRGAMTGAAGGATSGIPGMPGRILEATGQSNIGGDIMSSIMNRGQNEEFGGFNPGAQAREQQRQVQGGPVGVRPQGW